MPIEQLLFFLLLLAIPLLDRLVRTMRARTGDSPPERASVPVPPALPKDERRPAPDRLLASRRRPGVQRERMEPPAAVRPAVAPGDLRRAILWIAIIGPCRALDPNGGGPPAGGPGRCA